MTRTLQITLAAGLAVLLAAAGVFVASASTTKTARAATLRAKNTVYGKILVDSHGRTLYAFARDMKNRSRCNGTCAADWPPARTPAHPTVGAGVSKAKLKVIRRRDGSRQLSYNGHPLYRFAGDAKPGDTNGENLTEFGGRWDVVSNRGAVVRRMPSSASSGTGGTTTQPAPSGYTYPY